MHPNRRANADPIRITQVLRNLLNNAIKFTPEAGVVAVRTQMAGDRVAVEVQDTGIGMTAEVRQRLFQQFEQGDRSVTRRFGGLGLWLFLARSIVDLHGGSLSASSPGTNAGSTFRMELPGWVEDAPARLEQQVAGLGVCGYDGSAGRGQHRHVACAGGDSWGAWAAR